MNNISDIKQKIKTVVTGKKFGIILVVTVILIVTAVYFYKSYFKAKIAKDYVPNKEFAPGPRQGEIPTADLYFFYTQWCPHCKTARIEWNLFKKQLGNKTVKDKKINFIEVDCDQEKALAEKYKIEGYPTIILTFDNKVIEYDAKTTTETLHQFLDSSL
jgi:thiol-disulfide isomerase/thioredoxin